MKLISVAQEIKVLKNYSYEVSEMYENCDKDLKAIDMSCIKFVDIETFCSLGNILICVSKHFGSKTQRRKIAKTHKDFEL